MDRLHQQVARARRRLVMEQFFSIATRTLLVTALVAAVAVLVPKLWSLGFDTRQMQIWYAAWLGGGLLLGLAAGLVWTLLVRRSELDAAIEIDHRFGLKERVSSALALTPGDLDLAAGQALLNDAMRRAGRIEVSEKFRLRASPWFVVPPVLWGLALLLALLVPNALPQEAGASEQEQVAQQVKASIEELKKRIQERRERAVEAGLTDAAKELEAMEEQLDEMAARPEADRRETMIELNNLRQEIEDRRDELADSEALQQQLQNLGDLKSGPADELADAMKKGDFEEAQKQLEDLQEALANGDMTPEEQQALQEQMNQLANQLQAMADAHAEAKSQLEEQIREAQAAGNQQQAQQLQQQLDQLAQQDSQMNRMQNLAQQLSQCSQCMKNGDGQGAAQALAQLGDEISDLQQQAAEMQMLDEALDQLAGARDSMNCPNCQGQGCQQCQGQGNQAGQRPGNGLGQGRGQGTRPEADSNTQTYDSQVASNPQEGTTVVTGLADGPNLPGVSHASIQEAFESAEGDDTDPLVGQRVPKADQQFVQEYYDALRSGQLGPPEAAD